VTHSPLLWVADALAVYRLVRLVTSDEITARLRAWLGRPFVVIRSGVATVSSGRKPEGLRYQASILVGCAWCVGFWVAILVVVAQALIPGVWLYGSAVLAFSAAAGILSERV
jgi:uncharacterized protein DUF1360